MRVVHDLVLIREQEQNTNKKNFDKEYKIRTRTKNFKTNNTVLVKRFFDFFTVILLSDSLLLLY